MIHIRTALITDAASISNLVNSAYRGESSRQGWTTEVDLVGGTRTVPAKVEELIQKPGSRVELLFENEVLKACVHLTVEKDASLYLGMLSVTPLEQTRGFGKMLISHAEQLAKKLNLARVRMSVIDRRLELLAYYERRGYARTGKFEAFHPDEPHFGTPLLDDLKLLELEKRIG